MNKGLFLGVLILSGCGGSTGPAGPSGATGAPGAAGVAIASASYCGKISSGLLLEYRTVLYTTGDAWVACTVSGSSIGTSNTAVYRAAQAGSTTLYCQITADLDAASAGYWAFSSNAGKKAVYTDSSSASNGTTVAFLNSDCTAF